MKHDLFTTRQLAREGMERAIEKADREHSDWSTTAGQYLRIYAQMNREFMTEELRVWAHDKGLPKPSEPRAWGHVTLSAVRAGIIERDRYENTRIPPAHSTPRPVWRSMLHRGAQIKGEAA